MFLFTKLTFFKERQLQQSSMVCLLDLYMQYICTTFGQNQDSGIFATSFQRVYSHVLNDFYIFILPACKKVIKIRDFLQSSHLVSIPAEEINSKGIIKTISLTFSNKLKMTRIITCFRTTFGKRRNTCCLDVYGILRHP